MIADTPAPPMLDAIHDELAAMRTIIVTEDGNCLITDPEVGTVSRRTKEEAEAEIARRKAGRMAA